MEILGFLKHTEGWAVLYSDMHNSMTNTSGGHTLNFYYVNTLKKRV